MAKRTRELAAALMLAAMTAVVSFAQAATTGKTVEAGVTAPPGRWMIVMQGGAGDIEHSSLTADAERAYRSGMTRATQAAAGVLSANASAAAAVEAGLKVIEDDPIFGVGKGAAFTAAGTNLLAASVMDGESLKTGTVTGVTRTKNPIVLARAVMRKSPQAVLSGDAADSFAAAAGLQRVEPSYYFTEESWQSLLAELKRQGKLAPSRPTGVSETSVDSVHAEKGLRLEWGAASMVVRDRMGNLAAGVTTSGANARAADSDVAVPDAGIYASNRSCAVAVTGTSAALKRLDVAHNICALVQYTSTDLQQAENEVIQHQLMALKGEGGVIAITPDGQLAWSFNTKGMLRAEEIEGMPIRLGIYKDEP